jgi:integrase
MGMPEFRLQRLKGRWAIAEYRDGQRVSRHRLESRDAAGAAAEFGRLKAAASRPVDPDIGILWEAYRNDRAGRRIAENMQWSGKSVLSFFATMKPENITIALCRQYVAQRKRSPGTTTTELNHLRIVLRWAHKNHMIDRMPAMELPPRSPPRDQSLTRQDFAALLNASETPHLRLFLHLAIATAGRMAALTDLTWDRVDFERGLIYLGEHNVLRPRKGRATVTMTNALRAALSEARQGARTKYVLEWGGEPIKAVRTALGKAARRAGLTGVSPHVFRHSAARWMAEDGVPMREIAAVLGHADEQITARVYARFSPDYLRGAMASLEVGSIRRVK